MPTFTVKPLSDRWTLKTEVGKKTGTTVYLVLSDEPTTPLAVDSALGLPGIGSTYPGAPEGLTFRCISREPRPDGQTRMKFVVTCEYDNTVTYSPNPLDDDPVFSYDGETADETFFADTQSPAKKAQTTAYEPFPELPKRESSIAVINFSRNVASTASYADYYHYNNQVNSGAVTIDGVPYEDGQVKASVPSLSEIKDRDGYKYKVISCTFKARKDGWDQKYESRGLVELDTGYAFPITDSDGAPVEIPWPLDAAGAKKPNASDAGAEIVLKPYTRADLSGLLGGA